MSCTTCVNFQTTWKCKQKQHNVAGKALMQSQDVLRSKRVRACSTQLHGY